MDKALEDSGIHIKDIHEVLLVGGSTRIPLIQELVTQKFGKAPRKDINPDEAVALGAAVQAGIKSGVIDSKDGLMITDVSPYTLGVSIARMVGGQLMHGYFDRIIERNTTIPVTQSKVYCTIDDNQDAVTIRVFQGEDSYAENNNYLGEVTLPDLPMAPAGLEVKVTFQYNINGTLTVEAMIVTTGKKVVTTIRGQAGVMSEQELIEAKGKMTKTFEQSELYQSVKVVVNRAEQVLDELSGSEKEKIETLLDRLKQAAANNDSLMVSKYEEELTDLLIELV
ncbi:Chaperone protein DnaK [compost metagenome]